MHISYDHTLYELFHGSDQRRRYEAGTTVFSRVECTTGFLEEHQKAAFVNYVKKWLLFGRKSFIYCLKSACNNYK
jgi:hypothetical protein